MCIFALICWSLRCEHLSQYSELICIARMLPYFAIELSQRVRSLLYTQTLHIYYIHTPYIWSLACSIAFSPQSRIMLVPPWKYSYIKFSLRDARLAHRNATYITISILSSPSRPHHKQHQHCFGSPPLWCCMRTRTSKE